MAGKSLTQSQVIQKLSEKEQLPKKQVKSFLDNLSELAYQEAKNGFVVPGLGKLVLVKRKARKGRNPATGETIKIPAKKAIKFKIAKAAKDAILGGTAAKKTAVKKTATKKTVAKKTAAKKTTAKKTAKKAVKKAAKKK
ncbi:MAG: HU family DNA-binding protein [Chitinispirillaceae bacterium]